MFTILQDWSGILQNILNYSRLINNVVKCSRSFNIFLENGQESYKMPQNIPDFPRMIWMFENDPDFSRIISYVEKRQRIILNVREWSKSK